MNIRTTGVAPYRRLAMVALTVWAGVARAGTNVTWTGLGGDASWNNPANWDSSALPGPDDTAVFTNAGITANEVISLNASQTIHGLTIATTTGFTIGSTNDLIGVTNSLSLVDVWRQDVSGSENAHVLFAPVILATDSTWTVEGSTYLGVTGSISGAYGMTKLGSGQLRLGANTYTGDTIAAQGSMVLAGNISIRGNLTIGAADGSTTASVTSSGGSGNNRVDDSHNVTVNPGSTYSTGNDEGFAYLIIVGGTATMNYCNINKGTLMTGGRLAGGGGFATPSLHSYPTSTTAVINGPSGLNRYGTGNWTWTVDDGTAPIDLEIAAAVGSGNASYTLTKNGDGTVLLDKSTGSSYAYAKTIVSAGTLLVANTSGSGTGQSLVQVNAGATLGGTGIVGGVSGYTNANVSLVSGSSTNSMATIGPGLIDATTGDHIVGTLTVGGAAQTNAATFGNYSRLAIHFGSAPSCDRLVVYGSLNLGASGNQTFLDLTAAGSAPRGGEYTLATFGVLTGRFANVRLDPLIPPQSSVSYSGTATGNGDELLNGSIVLSVPSGGSTVIVR